MSEGSIRAFVLFTAVLAVLFGCATRTENNEVDRIASLDSLRLEALALVNRERGQNGLPALRANGALTEAAQAHAEDMARRGYYSHRSPEGRDMAWRYASHGGTPWRIVGENIASCNACAPAGEQLRGFHADWMGSPGHRRNILDGRFGGFGFGMASANGRLYAVQTFVGERR